jgi:hypothetical protein
VPCYCAARSNTDHGGGVARRELPRKLGFLLDCWRDRDPFAILAVVAILLVGPSAAQPAPRGIELQANT